MAGRALHVVITGDPRGFQAALAKAGAASGAFAARQKTTAAKVASAGTAMSRGITLPLLAAAGASVKLASTFEKQMSSLGSVANASGADMERLRKQAMKAGADTAYSAREAAIAQTELAKGVSTAKILSGGLGAALALAAAGELELAEASTVTANALNLFGMEGKDAGQIADAMATAANATTADVEDFGMALKQAGQVADMAGYSFTDTMVGLEAMAKSGLKNSDAGTSMKAAFQSLLGPSGKQADLQKKLGLNFIDSAGNMKDAATTADMLRDKLGGMTAAQRTATLKTLAGSDGVRYLSSLYKAGGDTLKGYEGDLRKQGTAADVAKKKQANLAGQVEQLKGSLETLGIMIGTVLIPPLTSVAKHATAFANAVGDAFGGLPAPMKTLTFAIVGVVAAVGPLLFIAGSVATAIAAIAAPVLITVGVLAALGVAFVTAYKHSATFRSYVTTAFDAVKAAAQVAAAWLIANVPRAFAAIKAAAAAAAGWLITNVPRAFDAVKGAAGALARALNLRAVWAAFKGAASAVVPLLTAMGAHFKRLVSIVRGVVGALSPILGPVLRAVFGLAVNVVRIAVQTIGGVFRGVLGVLRGVVQMLTGLLRGDFGTMWAGVKSIFSGAVTALGAIARGLVGLLRAAAVAAVKALVGALRGGVGMARSAATAIVRGAVAAFRSILGEVVGIGRAIVQGLVNGIKGMAGAVAQAAKGVVSDALNAAKSALKIGSPSRVTHEYGEWFSEGLANGITAGGASARAAVRAVGEGVLFELDAQIRDAQRASEALNDLFARTDKQRDYDAVAGRAGRAIGDPGRERKLRKVPRAAGADRRAALKHNEEVAAYNNRRKRLVEQNKDTKEAKVELAKLNEEAKRAGEIADIDFKIAGLERFKAFTGAIADVKGSLGELAKSAAQAFRKGREDAIDANLGATLATLDTSYAGELARSRKGIVADARVAELASLRAKASESSRDADDAEIADRLATARTKQARADEQVLKAKAALDGVAASGSDRLIGAAQRRLDIAKAASTAAAAGVAQVEADQRKIADARRIDELEAELDNARTVAEDSAAAARAGLDVEEEQFRSSLAARLADEAGQLEQRKQSYARFVADVQAILAPLGEVFAADADQEVAIVGPAPTRAVIPAPAAAKSKAKSKAKAKPRRRAGGGLVMARLGELTRVGELGPETVHLPRGARVTPASRSTVDNGRSGPLIGEVHIHDGDKLGADAIASALAFKLATRRR